jgi:hypothetical protein
MRPRFRLAIADDAACSTASLSRWTHRVGVTGGTLDQDTPTRDAIGLSSPVDVRGEVSRGELSPWRPNLPPPGGGGGQPQASQGNKC